MRSNSLDLLAAVATVMALVLLRLVFLQQSSSVPPDFQFQSHFSKRQAEMFYVKARQELRQQYWDGMRRNLKSLQFTRAWNRWRNGEGHLEGVVTNSNSDVMANVKFKNGYSFWITVQSASDRVLAKQQ